MNSKFLPRIQDVFFIALFAAMLLLGQRMLNLDGDLPRHLLMGKYILTNKSVPAVELFIYPYFDRLYVSHEWLADVIFYAIYLYAGLAGIAVLSAGLLASAFTLLYAHLSKRLHLRLPILFLVAWGAAATSLNWAVRPHLFSMLMLVIWLIWADDLRRGEKIPLWRFSVFMLVWSNVHGEFIAGILVLLAYSVGWIIDYLLDRTSVDLSAGKNLWISLGTSAIASLLNPGGIGTWVSFSSFMNNKYLMSRMAEANAPDFQAPEMRVLFGLLIFSVFLLALKKEKTSAAHGLLLAGFSAMSMMAIRNVHLYGIVAPFVLAETLDFVRQIHFIDQLETTLHKIEHGIKGIGWMVVPALVVSVFAVTNSAAKNFYQFRPSFFPVQAVTWLEQNPQRGNMFNDLNWGGYISLHLYPQLIFIDSMADVTGEVTLQYETVVTLSVGWQDILKQHDVEWAIVRNDSLLAKKLQSEYHWKILYQDESAVILRK